MEHPKDPQAAPEQADEQSSMKSELDHAQRLIENMGSEKAHLLTLLAKKDQELVACMDTSAETVQRKEEECSDRLQELESELHAVQMRLEDQEAEVQTAYEEAAEEVQRERESIVHLEETHRSELENQRQRQQELEAELLKCEEKLETVDIVSRSAFEDGLAAGNRTQSDLQIEVEALAIQLEEEKSANHDVKAVVSKTAEKLQAEVDKSDTLVKEREQLLEKLANSQSKYNAQAEEYEQRLSAEREMFESHMQAELSRQKETFENSFEAEKKELEARAEEACAVEVKKLLDALQKEKDTSRIFEDELESLRREKVETSFVLETVQSELQASNSGIKESGDTIEKLKKEKNTLKQEISKLKTNLKEKADELLQVTGDKTSVQDDRNALEKELQAVKSSSIKERESFQAEVESLTSRLHLESELVGHKSAENEALQVEINALKDDLGRTIESSALNRDELRTEMSNLKEAGSDRDKQYTKLLAEKETLSKDMNMLREELVSAKSSFTSSEEALIDEVESLKKAVLLRDAELAEVSAEKETVQRKLDELKIVVKERKPGQTLGRTPTRARALTAKLRPKSPTMAKARGDGFTPKSGTSSSRSKSSLYGTVSFKSRTTPVGNVAVMFCIKPSVAHKKVCQSQSPST